MSCKYFYLFFLLIFCSQLDAQSALGKHDIRFEDITVKDFRDNNLSTIEEYKYGIKRNGKVSGDSFLICRKTYDKTTHSIHLYIYPYPKKKNKPEAHWKYPDWIETEYQYDSSGKLLWDVTKRRIKYSAASYETSIKKNQYIYNAFDSLSGMLTTVQRFFKENELSAEALNYSDTTVLEFLYNGNKQLHYVYEINGKEKILQKQYLYTGNVLSAKLEYNTNGLTRSTRYAYHISGLVHSVVDSFYSVSISHGPLEVHRLDFEISGMDVTGFRKTILLIGRGWSDSSAKVYDAYGNLVSEWSSIASGGKTRVNETVCKNTYSDRKLYRIERMTDKKILHFDYIYSSSGLIVSEKVSDKKKLKLLVKYFYH